MGFGLGIEPKLRSSFGRVRQALRNLTRPRLILRGSRENLAVVFSEPHDMSIGDRIVLYSLVRGLKPRGYLEIGVRWGGSARIVATAMEANGFGYAVGLDPNLTAFRPSRAELHGRYQLVQGFSPEDTGTAAAKLDTPLEMIFIDAVHTYSAVKADLAGALPYLAEGGYILLHDAFHQGIDAATKEFLADHPNFHDLGIVSRNAVVGDPVSYNGLRLMRHGPEDFAKRLHDAHQNSGKPPPLLSKEFWDHDPYAIRIGNAMGRKDSDAGGTSPKL
jgi:predicted O-methyltransferase YrrM